MRSLFTSWPSDPTSGSLVMTSSERIVCTTCTADRRFIWPYDDRARLAGEHLYEDKTSLRIEEVDRSEAITPARVREIHRHQLARLEAERGPNFWVLGGT